MPTEDPCEVPSFLPWEMHAWSLPPFVLDAVAECF
jgi:hypothetical protein